MTTFHLTSLLNTSIFNTLSHMLTVPHTTAHHHMMNMVSHVTLLPCVLSVITPSHPFQSTHHWLPINLAPTVKDVPITKVSESLSTPPSALPPVVLPLQDALPPDDQLPLDALPLDVQPHQKSPHCQLLKHQQLWNHLQLWKC
jgi:hypothetical protein